MSGILEPLFRRTCAAKRRAVGDGTSDAVTINGQEYEDALADVLTATEVFMAGGKGESGGYRVQVLISDLPDSPPKKFDPIVVRGQALQILSIDDINGLVSIFTAGDPITET